VAALITTTFPINGSNNFVARIDITGDSAGDVTATPVIDPKAAISGVQVSVGLNGLPTNIKIKSINYNMAGLKAALLWDATTPVIACALSEYDGEIDFFEMGAPLLNNAGTGKTGKLLLSTTGLAAGDYGTIIIKGYHE
jgi:hypothetical protein